MAAPFGRKIVILQRKGDISGENWFMSTGPKQVLSDKKPFF